MPLRSQGDGRHGMRTLTDDELTVLAGEPMVAALPDGETPEISGPFVLQFDHFYLRRNFMHEVAVAAILRRRRAEVTAPMRPMTDADLDALFDGNRDEAVQPQRQAVQQLLGRRLFVLTGGPGTGKTTTVLRMLLALGREHIAKKTSAPVIRISAPTGKAAQRLTDSLRAGSSTLRSGASLLSAEWSGLLDSALGAESSTLHRLLGSRGHQGGFSHHAGNRIPADIVVVDEASMVDLAMLRALLEALRDDAILVLVGDADQLTSVGTGSVLLDLVTAMEADGGPDLVRLHHSFRADQALVPINDAIRRGDMAAFESAWQSAGSRAVRYQVGVRAELNTRLKAWSRDLHATLDAAGAFGPITGGGQAVRAVLSALREQQLLCARRESEFGAEQVNDAIEMSLRKKIPYYENETWFPGRAVMITRNDYAYDLFNGDVGVCLLDENDKLQVWFESSPDKSSAETSSNEQGCLRIFAPGSLPLHQGAFATTVHKSQGSEYEQVAVLLPADKDNAVLSRQLLYTALSRAERKAEIWGTEDVLQSALGASIDRSSALQQRLMYQETKMHK